jgi:hypothetical protein
LTPDLEAALLGLGPAVESALEDNEVGRGMA